VTPVIEPTWFPETNKQLDGFDKRARFTFSGSSIIDWRRQQANKIIVERSLDALHCP
jgi:hypothetical protein